VEPVQVDSENRPVVAQVIDNLMLWLFVGTAVGILYAVWATVEILTQYSGVMPPVSPFGPGR
jgi:hypothetical protein